MSDVETNVSFTSLNHKHSTTTRLFCAYIVYVKDAIVDTKMAETNGLNDYVRSRSHRLGQKQMRP